MGRLKRSLVLLIGYMLFLASISQFPAVNGMLVLDGILFPFVAVAVVTTLVLPTFRTWSNLVVAFLWSAIYLAVWYVFGAHVVALAEALPLVAVEMILLTIAILLSRDVAVYVYELEHTIDKLIYASFSGRTLLLEDAMDDIKTELTRSRRYHRPLSLILIEPDANSLREEFQPTLKEIQQHMARRYTMAHLAEVLNKEARRTDMIIKQGHPERFILLCPETPSSNTNTLVNRIVDSAREHTGVSVGFGIASFPEEALTFEELINKAHSKMYRPATYTLSEANVEKQKVG